MQRRRFEAVICTVCFVLGALSFGIGQMDRERYYLFGVWGIGLMCAAAFMWVSFIGWLLIFWTLAILACVQVMLNEAFVVGFAALVACALCSIGGAGFMGSLAARREKRYRGIVLLGIGAVGLIALAAGLAVMMWSGFSMHLFEKPEIDGVTWALLAACTGALAMTTEEAIWGGVRG